MMAAIAIEQVGDEAPGVVATLSRIDAWMEVANAGDTFVYASRCSLPIGSAGAKRMRELAERGLVYLTRPRSALNPTIFNYTAQRSSKPTALTRPVRPVLGVTAAPVGVDEVTACNAVLAVLSRFAQAGRPCPTDKQLAERTALPVEAIGPTLRVLVATHAIRVQGLAPPTYRRVTIVATGAITGLAA